jgi:DNA-binding NtrC family response regulator
MPTASPTEKSAKTIVVVAPDNLYRRALRCLLSSDGYEVETFLRAEEFAAEADPGEFDCLVVDIDLPECEPMAQAHIDLASCLRDELPVILVAPKSSWVPRELALPTVSKSTPDSVLLALVHQSLFGLGL